MAVQPIIVEIVVGGIRGPQGEQGPQGNQGIVGNAGQGVPAGGATNKILEKTSGVDYATDWTDTPTLAGLTINGHTTVTGYTRTTSGGGLRSTGDLFLDTETTGNIFLRTGFTSVVQVHLNGDTDFIWGNVELIAVGQGLIMKSPNGNRWRLTPSNAGASVWTAL